AEVVLQLADLFIDEGSGSNQEFFLLDTSYRFYPGSDLVSTARIDTRIRILSAGRRYAPMWHGLDHLGVRERTSGAPSTPCRMRSHRFHRCFLFAPVVAHLLLIGGVMTPRTQHAPPASQPLTRRSSLARGSSAARERWIAPHDPPLRGALQAARAPLRL